MVEVNNNEKEIRDFADEIEEYATKKKDPRVYEVFRYIAEIVRKKDEHIKWLDEILPNYAVYLMKITDSCNAQLNTMNKGLNLCYEILEKDTKYIDDLERMFLNAERGEYYFSNAGKETRTSSLSDLYDDAKTHALDELNELRKKYGRSQRNPE